MHLEDICKQIVGNAITDGLDVQSAPCQKAHVDPGVHVPAAQQVRGCCKGYDSADLSATLSAWTNRGDGGRGEGAEFEKRSQRCRTMKRW